MAVYIPTVTNYANGIVSITSTDGTPYYQIQNSIGEIRYFLNALYIQAANNNQLSQPIEFYHYDANGNIKKFAEIPLIDIFQFQPVLDIDMKSQKVVFEGNTFLNVTLLPLEMLYIRFDITEHQNRDFLPKNDFISTNDFFKQFNEEL